MVDEDKIQEWVYALEASTMPSLAKEDALIALDQMQRLWTVYRAARKWIKSSLGQDAAEAEAKLAEAISAVAAE